MHHQVRYPSDGFSLYPAMTLAGLRDLLPVSPQLAARYPCLGALPVRADLGEHRFADKFAARASRGRCGR
jgi:hypothetical protein